VAAHIALGSNRFIAGGFESATFEWRNRLHADDSLDIASACLWLQLAEGVWFHRVSNYLVSAFCAVRTDAPPR
jgi:hypothetical protein